MTERDKTTHWAFTAYEDQWALFAQMPAPIAEWGWQEEICPDTGRKHYQGYMRTRQQHRFKGSHPAESCKKLLPKVHIEPCGWKHPEKTPAQNWIALKTYCGKSDTSVPGTKVFATNDIPSKYTYSDEIANKLDALHPEGFDKWDLPQLLQLVRETCLLEIEEGRRGIEWIITDPAWKVLWKDCGRSMIARSKKARLASVALAIQTDRQTDECVEPTDEIISPAEV